MHRRPGGREGIGLRHGQPLAGQRHTLGLGRWRQQPVAGVRHRDAAVEDRARHRDAALAPRYSASNRSWTVNSRRLTTTCVRRTTARLRTASCTTVPPATQPSAWRSWARCSARCRSGRLRACWRCCKAGLIGTVGLAALAGSALFSAAQLGRRSMQRKIDLGDIGDLAELRTTTPGADASNIKPDHCLFRSPGYSNADWSRMIGHGVKPDGRPALVMPSEDQARVTHGDLSALVSFLRKMPAQSGQHVEIRFPLPVKAMMGPGLLRDAASKIDISCRHRTRHPKASAPSTVPTSPTPASAATARPWPTARPRRPVRWAVCGQPDRCASQSDGPLPRCGRLNPPDRHRRRT